MRYSQIFPKTSKNAPADEPSSNARLLEQGGFIRKHMAGVYNLMPLGLLVLNKINQIIREEMNAAGGQEVDLAVLQPKELWDKTGRWESLTKEVMYKVSDTEGLAPTHEEVIANIAAKAISSYKDLPLYLYQIQTKFRNEPRPRFGLIRCREFMMKDLYSIDISEEEHKKSYQKFIDVYFKTFERLGLEVKLVEASGGVFSKEFSHEFQVLIDSGEDEIVYCNNCDFAQNREVNSQKEGEECPKCKSKLKVSNAIEVGNVFHLGTRFSEPLGLSIKDEKGEEHPAVMGSYGIGPTRVLGTLVEVYHDDRGIIWPKQVAPFTVYLIDLTTNKGEDLYKKLNEANVEVLFDDRDVSAGEKFATADLLGIPYRLVLSEKTRSASSGQAGDKIELKERKSGKIELVEFADLIRRLQPLRH